VRTDRVYQQQVESLDKTQQYKEFYMKRFSNIDAMVEVMKGTQRGARSKRAAKAANQDLVQTSGDEEPSVDAKRTSGQGSLPAGQRQRLRDRSSSGSAEKTGSMERVSY
jgi:hypothetical protein